MDEPHTPNPPALADGRAPRHDGWTPEIRADFIAALAESGSVTAATRAVARHFTSAYRLRARDEQFRRAWDAAAGLAYARLREVAIDRAVNGETKPVWHKGEVVGRMHATNDKLLMFLLEHLRGGVPDGRLASHRRSHGQSDNEDAFAFEFDALIEPPPPPPRGRNPVRRLLE